MVVSDSTNQPGSSASTSRVKLSVPWPVLVTLNRMETVTPLHASCRSVSTSISTPSTITWTPIERLSFITPSDEVAVSSRV